MMYELDMHLILHALTFGTIVLGAIKFTTMNIVHAHLAQEALRETRATNKLVSKKLSYEYTTALLEKCVANTNEIRDRLDEFLGDSDSESDSESTTTATSNESCEEL